MVEETLCSFRDPSGAVFLVKDRVLRKVADSATAETRDFLESAFAARLLRDDQLISTREVSAIEFSSALDGSKLNLLDLFGTGGSSFEHERIWFPSYAYEWPAEMLFSAGMLTLDIAEKALDDGFGLKDATPYNVLFRGSKPVFVDLLSFEKRDPKDYIWLPYAQFVRMFLFPLLLFRDFGAGLDQIFTTRSHGLEPEELYAQYGWMQRLRPPLLTEVSFPTWLKSSGRSSGKDLYSKRSMSDPEKAKFVLKSQFKRLRRALKKAAPPASRSSHWSDYMKTLSYSDQEFNQKSRFVESAMTDLRPATVLDIGCNTGHFSVIAAKSGARVVGLDIDAAVVGSTWRRASDENLNILPLVVNLARPTPSTGWRNSEYPSFFNRASGKFELVLMLATLHHLLVTERIPLNEIIQLVSELTTDYAIIEYVDKNDPMFQQITRGRENLHEGFTRSAFETACLKHFSISRAESTKGDLRRLYLLRKRS